MAKDGMKLSDVMREIAMRRLTPKLLLCLGLATWTSVAAADDIAEAGRALVAEKSEAVVTIRMVIKETFSFGSGGSDSYESILETTGSVIREDGLLVASLSATDPSKLYEDMFADWEDDDFKMDIHSEIDEITIILADGEEIPAKIVLRDSDLDLVFIRPEKKADRPFAHFDLSKSPSSAQFDQVAVLYRLGKVANRAITAGFPRVLAVMEKPRRLYVLSTWSEMMTWTGLGRPVFTLDGHFVGVTVLRIIKTVGSGSTSMLMDGENAAAEVVVPAADILESAQQAPPQSTQ